MAQNPAGALFCDNIGQTNDSLRCCYPNDQASQVCRDNFNTDAVTFKHGCPDSNCIEECADVTKIYQSILQKEVFEGDGTGPIRRFRTCANVPAIAGYLRQDVLKQSITSTIGDRIPAEAADEGLKKVTYAVTECLTSTCRNARHRQGCRESCSSVNMLLNSTAPNIKGINDCLFSLCNGGYDSLPYADADIVGIGVFASYIMQCVLVVVLLFGLTAFEYNNHQRRKYQKPSQATERLVAESKALQNQDKRSTRSNGDNQRTHQSIFENALVQFHKAQCYFSATLQIASLSYDIFGTDMLTIFMLTPLATNGVLPVVFTYIMLIRCGKATLDVTLLSTVCWLLSTIVYWILYSSIIPINGEIRNENKRYRAYQQFMYKLSAIDACGGYSALAVCPNNNFELGRRDLPRASHRLRVLTPMVWGFSTFCLLAALSIKFRERLRRRNYQKTPQSEGEGAENSTFNGAHQPETEPALFSDRRMRLAYYLTVLCFLAGIGMQLSLLSINTSLEMMNRKNWGFGQIVAVTLWAPAILGYIYEESEKLLGKKKNGGN